MTRVWSLCTAALLASAIVACRTDTTAAPEVPGARNVAQSGQVWEARPRLEDLRGDAREQIARAVGGRTVRGDQDEMLRIEAALPGFAGYYIDDT